MTPDNEDALKCADLLDAGENFFAESSMWFDSKLAESASNASDHIRRLVHRDESAEALHKQVLDVLAEIHPGNMTPMAESAWNQAIAALRERLGDKA
jgi:hypothetical protein